jgi:hypothetical protein
MGYQVTDIELTPNRNAIKVTVDQPVSDKTRSYAVAAEPVDHPVAQALLNLQGVAGVMLLKQTITISKRSSANWDELQPMIRRTLANLPEDSARNTDA